MDMRRLVGENVRRVRQEKGLTQEQLAEASGFRLDEATVAYWVTFSDEAIRLPILIAAQQTGTRVICRTSHGACYNRVENCSHACLGGANRSIFSGLSPEDEQMVDTLDSPHWTPGPWRADPGGGNCYGIFGRDGDTVAFLAQPQRGAGIFLLPLDVESGLEKYGRWDEHAANAYLLAAAPDLYSALEELIAASALRDQSRVTAALDRARSAVNKARPSALSRKRG